MKLSEFFKNTSGQFAIEEVLKPLAIVAGVVIGFCFFFTGVIPADKAEYVMKVEAVLFGYALGQGIVGNVTKQ